MPEIGIIMTAIETKVPESGNKMPENETMACRWNERRIKQLMFNSLELVV